MPWVYDASAHQYRDADTGQRLSPTQQVAVRDDFIQRSVGALVGLTRALTRGLVGLPAWEERVLGELAHLHVAAYLFGRGGRHVVDAQDRAAIERLVERQADYLHAFAGEIAAGGLSARQIEARIALYVSATTHSAEVGQAARYADLALPAMPGDGSTACRSNCRCSWTIVEDDDAWRCTWTLHAEESCPDCRSRAERYSPLIVPRG